MEIKKINTGKKEIILIEGCYNETDIATAMFHLDFKGIKAEFICYCSKMTEEIAAGIVRQLDKKDFHGQHICFVYWNYDFYRPDINCKTALESWKSLLRSEGYVVENPCGEKPSEPDYVTSMNKMENILAGDIYKAALNKWEEAEKLVKQYIVLEILK